MDGESLLHDTLVKVLAEVDIRVFEFSAAARCVANAPSLMLLTILSCSYSEVTHVLSSTCDANLQIGITV